MFAALIVAFSVASPNCWQIYDDAVRHSALALHPPYIQYDERIEIDANQRPLVLSRAHIDYRDDGLARVVDERFDNDPIVTRQAEPGPPVLGPYGANRASWIPNVGETAYPLISDVRTHGDSLCEIAGTQTYKGHETYHLKFTHAKNDRPQLKGLWVDMHSSDIWKVALSGYVYFAGADKAPPLADFEVELSYSGPYLMVNHVVWAYRDREYSQWDDYFGEYYLSGFQFPPQLSNAIFASAGNR